MQTSKDSDDDQDELQAPDDEDHPGAENEKSNSMECDEQTKSLPIDRGWAWLVLAGVVFYFFLFGGVRKNFGIFFVAFQRRYESTASVTSLLSTVQNIVMSVSALIVMTIGLHVASNRTLVMIGAALMTLSNIITAYTTDIRVLLLSFGCMEAIGTSLVHPPTIAIIAEYFDKRRGFATGLAYSGASVGSLVFASVFSFLFEYHGYSGTMMIVAGMMLNFMITGSLMRPLKSFERHRKVCKWGSKFETGTKTCERGQSCQRNPLLGNELVNNVNKDGNIPIFRDKYCMANADKHDVLNERVNSGHGLLCKSTPALAAQEFIYLVRKSHVVKSECQLHAYSSRQIRPHRAHSLEYASSHKCFMDFDKRVLFNLGTASTDNVVVASRVTSKSSSNISAESLPQDGIMLHSRSIDAVVPFADEDEYHYANHDKATRDITSQRIDTNETTSQTCSLAMTKLFALVFDVDLFKTPVFLVFLVLAFLAHAASMAVVAFLASHGKDIGLSSDDIGVLMTIVGTGDLVARLCITAVSYIKHVKRTSILATALIAVGVTSQFVRFYTSYTSMLFFAAIIGLTCGVYLSIYAVILMDYLTLAKFKPGLGVTMMCHCVAAAATLPVAGVIRDYTGSYVGTYHVLGSMQILGAGIAVLLPHVYQWQQQNSSTHGSDKSLTIDK